VLGLASAFDNPTRQSFVIEMVGPEDVSNAVALNSSLFNMSRIVGPSIAGSLIAWSSLAVCFWINAASYLAVIGALALMRSTPFTSAPARSRAGLLGQLREGLHYALTTRDVCLIVILLFTFGAFGNNFNVFLPLLARYALDAGPFGLGVLFSCLGAGSVVAAMAVAGGGVPSERRLFIGAAAFALGLMIVAGSSWFGLTAGLMVLLGIANISFSTAANTRLQLGAPPALRGRVMSLYTLLQAGTTPIGSLTIGVISEHGGVRLALVVCGLICSLGLLAAWLYAQRVDSERRAEAAPEQAMPDQAAPKRHVIISPGQSRWRGSLDRVRGLVLRASR
jgi:MFS family permease